MQPQIQWLWKQRYSFSGWLVAIIILYACRATGGRCPCEFQGEGAAPTPRKLSSQRKRRQNEAQLFKLQQDPSAHTPLAQSKPHDQPHSPWQGKNILSGWEELKSHLAKGRMWGREGRTESSQCHQPYPWGVSSLKTRTSLPFSLLYLQVKHRVGTQ